MSKTLITSRDSKGLHAVGLFEAVYNKSKLNNERAQRLNERGGELQDGIAKLIAELSVSNRYANEEVSSSYMYPKEYTGPKPIVDQIKAIAKIFDLDQSQAIEYAKNLPSLGVFVPNDAIPWVGWFAIPSVDALAKKYFPEVTDPAEKYCRTVQLILGKISASRSFYNHREGQITSAQLRVCLRTAEMMQKISAEQPGDILIIATQLGMRHRGRSSRRAVEVFAANEFGLGSLAMGSIALTHPERFVRYDELDVFLPGDEFSPGANGLFGKASHFHFYDGRLGFGTCDVERFIGGYGSASAFLPQ